MKPETVPELLERFDLRIGEPAETVAPAREQTRR